MESFPYGDIIVIAAIAAFIILRYRATLGQNSGFDVTKKRPSNDEQEEARVVQLHALKDAIQAEVKAAQDEADPALAEEFIAFEKQYEQIRKLDNSFRFESFLGGAKTAFEMVIDAFAERDHDTLKMLLDKETYAEFNEAIGLQEEKNQTQHTTLIGISDADITDVTLNGKTAEITVAFTSEQMSAVKDKDGEVVAGDESKMIVVEDEWIFSRNLTSSSPNWTVIET